MLLSLAGCGITNIDPQEDNLTFVYNGIPIMLGAEAAPIIEALGEPQSYTEEASCAFDGLDKTYYYGSFYLSTCPMENVDCINMLWFADDTVATAEGIRIGDAQDQAEAAYGGDAFNGTNAYVVTKGKNRLTVVITDGIVSGIRYEGITD